MCESLKHNRGLLHKKVFVFCLRFLFEKQLRGLWIVRRLRQSGRASCKHPWHTRQEPTWNGSVGTLRSNGEINDRSRVQVLKAKHVIERTHLATSDTTRPSTKQP